MKRGRLEGETFAAWATRVQAPDSLLAWSGPLCAGRNLCPTCGNEMASETLPSPMAKGVMLMVHLTRSYCTCCEDADAIRAEQQRDPRGDAWPEAR